MRNPILISLFLVVSTLFGKAQSKSNELYYLDNRGKDALFAPRVGVGAGVFTYFGDVNDNKYQHIFTSTYGFEFLASANLTHYLDINLTAIYGSIGINERTTERNLNFKSEMFIGGVGVSYNFNHLYKKPSVIQPFIGFGVAFINFDTKSDMYDANGNRYIYVEGGGIQNSAGETIQRDYTYETDLRDENLDNLGKYDQFTFSLPVTAGIDFKMGKRISAKLSTSFHYTFTDLIDDISDKGEGQRAGNSRNDMFIFSSVSVSYSIGAGKRKIKSSKEKYFEEVDFYAMHLEDTDEDGINDFDDKCALTPQGVRVDENGCPIDTDLDVIADFRDAEGGTAEGNVVDLAGVTLTPAMMLKANEDSLATERARMHQIYPSGVIDRIPAISTEDSLNLAIMIIDIQNKIEEEGEFDRLFKEINKEVSNTGNTSNGSVENVYRSVDRLYKEMVESKKISPTKPLAITKEQNIENTIPPEFADADYNNDGLITSEEVMRIIEDVLEGVSTLNISQLYNLLDYYNEYMEDAKVIDFGGTMAFYVDGTLNILEKNNQDESNETHRFLAKKFKEVDFNKDDKLDANEVNQMISLFHSGQSSYTQEMIHELINLFFEE